MTTYKKFGDGYYELDKDGEILAFRHGEVPMATDAQIAESEWREEWDNYQFTAKLTGLNWNTIIGDLTTVINQMEKQLIDCWYGYAEMTQEQRKAALERANRIIAGIDRRQEIVDRLRDYLSVEQ